MTVEAIQDAITDLSEPERLRLAAWFDELKEDEWDRRMEQDFSPGGSGYHLVDQADRDIQGGKFTSLEDGLSALNRKPADRK